MIKLECRRRNLRQYMPETGSDGAEIGSEEPKKLW